MRMRSSTGSASRPDAEVTATLGEHHTCMPSNRKDHKNMYVRLAALPSCFLTTPIMFRQCRYANCLLRSYVIGTPGAVPSAHCALRCWTVPQSCLLSLPILLSPPPPFTDSPPRDSLPPAAHSDTQPPPSDVNSSFLAVMCGIMCCSHICRRSSSIRPMCIYCRWLRLTLSA